MSFLDDLTKDQRDLLVALPYRVGLFVSECDDSGGEESDEAEKQALENIITAYSQEVFGAETVQYIISKTVDRKSEWPEWSKNLDFDKIEAECHQAVDILSGVVDYKEVTAFKNYLVEIGESVALAFREYGEKTSLMDKFRVYMIYRRAKAAASKYNIPYKDWEEFINISLHERRALESIARALNVIYV
ncbi:MAG: hypothetical protein GC137_08800 [Alphaproteobacteria bacterium]|nr:hypothetical protein [Alphaproteobacteria bacterium]